MKILFFGTPRFAEIILEGLIKSDFQVVGVVCQNDKRAGRGNKLASPNIVSLAKSFDLPVFQFENIKEHIEDFKHINYDLAVTASYGKILPKEFLQIKECINVHPSLLPKYRGATPIQTAILNGDNITGVSIMKTEVGMDDGDIYAQAQCEILPEDDYTSLHDKLAVLGLKLLLQTINDIKNGRAKREKQDPSKATFVKLIKKEDALLDFTQSAKSIVNKVRAFVENPVAYLTLNNDRIKIYKARCTHMGICANVGEILMDKKRFLIQAVDDVVEVLECQNAGGKRLLAKDFLNGYRFKTRQVL